MRIPFHIRGYKRTDELRQRRPAHIHGRNTAIFIDFIDAKGFEETREYERDCSFITHYRQRYSLTLQYALLHAALLRAARCIMLDDYATVAL